MEKNDLVSILMPAKNAAKYLEACLKSILDQTYSNWELLVTNDHSTDDTFSLLSKFAKQDARIRVFQNVDHGIIAALRLAYSQAKGKYITRMDADDLMSKDKLTLLVEACEDENTLATGLVTYFSDQPLGDGYIKYANWLNGNLKSKNPFQSIYKECVIPSPCWMMFKSTLNKMCAFDSDLYPEDYDLCFRMRKAGLQVRVVDSVLHHWRDYPERSSRTDPNYADNRFLDLKMHYFLQNDLDADRPLVLWGAGKKGKAIAKMLVKKEIIFHWVSNNENKIGHDIYGVDIEGEEVLKKLTEGQVIISIAGVEDQEYVKMFLARYMGLEGFWFC